MQKKTMKTNTQQSDKMKSVRVRLETQKKAKRILSAANNKGTGRSVKVDELLSLSLDLVTEEHIKVLQERSLTNANRQELLRRKYSELYGPVTPEEYIGVTLTPAYFDFLKEHGHIVSVG